MNKKRRNPEPENSPDHENFWEQSSAHYFDIQCELKLTALHPTIESILGNVRGTSILDFGCGEGGLARRLAQAGSSVVAVDKSKRALERCQSSNGAEHLSFKQVQPGNYSVLQEAAPYDWIIMSLVLVTIEDEAEAKEVFSVLADVLAPGGRLILADSHPCFRNHIFSTFEMQLDNQEYRFSPVPFPVTVLDGVSLKSVNFIDWHRPLDRMVDLVTSNGLKICSMQEIYDRHVIEGLHVEARSRYNKGVPAFLIIEAGR